MASKRKREVEEDNLSTPASKLLKQDEVTRSGRVRKKPAKFVEEEEEAETKLDVTKLPRSPPAPRVQQAQVPATSPVPSAKIVMVPVKQDINQEVLTQYKEDVSSTDEDVGKTAGRSSRARKKSAKVLEMEEFEEAEKKQVKKDPNKKSKSPVAQTGHGEAQPIPTTNLPNLLNFKEEDDGLMIPEEEVVTTEKKGGKDSKKKSAKGKKKTTSLQLGDIPSTGI
ncbi:neurofilament medium polypeptide-like [Mercenaria mercenaria]|uniref:neurofilament medium polypeptide-like n=1 Tax=Mercenaria mercenaria TaxID=6596 RepID=UPI00234EB059|nr:neurofilament medium polypeptide-like [Mercenaria mercenaria]